MSSASASPPTGTTPTHPSADAPTRHVAPSPITKWIKLASLAVILVSLILIVRTLPTATLLDRLATTVDGLGVMGPVLYGLAYIAAALLFVPGSALTLGAGAIFDLVLGTIVVSLAATTAAALAFLIARYVARDAVLKWARKYPKFTAIDRAIGQGGWKIIFLLRLSPAVPFSLGNYLFGLTAIKFWPYTLASWVGMMPGTFMFVYFGYAAKAATAAASAGSAANPSGGGGGGFAKTAMLIVGLIATVAVTIYVTKIAARAVKEQTDAAPQNPEQNEAHTETTTMNASQKTGSPWSVVGLVLVALLFAAAAACATLKADAIRGLFGPPAVTLAEAYERTPDGPDFDHTAFDALLGAHVNAQGGVNYNALTKDAEKLDAYIASLAAAPLEKLGRDQKLALLLNAYNAFTLRLILDHAPINSIKDIPATDRWDAKRWNLAGQTLSLNQIEHEQVRPKFSEPRIHFALVCAAVGCPPLRTEAYAANRLEEQLESQAVYVHTHDRWLQDELNENKIGITALYNWYGGDFKQAASADSVLPFVARYHQPLKKLLDAGNPPAVEFLDYDWSLNSQKNLP